MSNKLLNNGKIKDVLELYTKYDIIFIILFSTVSLVIIIYHSAYKKLVSSNLLPDKVIYKIYIINNINKEKQVITLYKPPANLKLEVEGMLGKTVIEWDTKGNVRIASSPCKNQICVNTGWIKPPFFSFCAPNGVGVQCYSKEAEFDGITQ